MPEKEKRKKNKDGETKPRYNMWQNCAFMIALAWRKKEKKVPLLCLVQAALAVAISLVNLYISPSVLGKIEQKAPLAQLTGMILAFAGGLILLSAVAAYVDRNVLYGRITVRSAIIDALNKKMSTTSYPNLGDEKFEKLSARASAATGNNQEATEAVWETLTSLLKNGMGFMIYLLLLSNLEPWMILVIAGTSLMGFFIGRQVNGYSYRHREEVAVYEKQMWYISNQAKDAKSAKDIRIFAFRPWLEELGEKAMEAYMDFHRRAGNIAIWGRIADVILTFLRNGIAYAWLIGLVIHDGLGAAEFLLYFSAVGGFASWVTGILGDLATLHRQSLDLSTVRECLEYPELFRFEEGEAFVPEPGRKYEIRLEDVSFRYPGADKDTLSHINLTLRPGEKLAVVGLNGAGKTTLVKLICGFYDPTEGRVLLDGKDIRQYNRRDYYRLFSAVFQAFTVLAGTVAANVAQTEDGIDRERVWACLEKAGLREKIESLPAQADTCLNRDIYEEAVMLSGGETQRLMLARALYRDAPVIILDEPTAALDPLAEADMYRKYNEMTTGKSSVYISHRLASTRFCDRIIFVEDSRIAEEGTHEQLLDRGGRYAELFEVQSRYYRAGGEEK